MRREFTAISAFSMAIALGAGVVLCMQVATMNVQLGWELSAPVVWALEVGVFGTAVYAWCSAVSLGGWVMGIAGLELVRLVLSIGAAAGLAATRGSGHLSPAMVTTSTLEPRMCAVLFALMVFYPLRTFLPVRSARPARRRRFSESAAVRSALGGVGSAESELVIWAGAEQTVAREERSARAARSMLDSTQRPVDIAGAVELPVRAVLAQMPAELLNDRAQKVDGSQMMSIPLGVILPQLKEARVMFSPARIRDWLPDSGRRAVAEPAGDAADQESVALPLALIVPQLPPEALALPPPSPPAWANVDRSEHIVFART